MPSGALVSSGYPFEKSRSAKGTGVNFGYEHTVPTSTVLSTEVACRVASSGEHRLGGTRPGEIELTRPRRPGIGTAIGETGDHPSTQEPGTSGDDHASFAHGAVGSVVRMRRRHPREDCGHDALASRRYSKPP